MGSAYGRRALTVAVKVTPAKSSHVIHVYTVYNAIYGDHDYDKCGGAANFDLHVSGADPEGGEGDVHPL